MEISALESGGERVSGVGAILYKTDNVSFPGKVKFEQMSEVDEEASQADIKGKCLKHSRKKRKHKDPESLWVQEIARKSVMAGTQ